ncbi:hypothetical protein PAXRUDRAFT_26633 [Paxillus rubicundulus Ve08.2h10]|uniref:Unplaced genomic scaffold scaffold_433, whole genome shotgun sequence n=1 Tax=Paxillus rubicundulus Ve08.2h10 TaxID=930991 RepID=A0A0D0DZP1_9AGAM|nr:hypothetical protein PAXRUDRAFT_26633 [Paxillus rubicundulus Ve08.2h10]
MGSLVSTTYFHPATPSVPAIASTTCPEAHESQAIEDTKVLPVTIVPSENDVFHVHWSLLEGDIHHIMSLGTAKSHHVPTLSYMSHYTMLYNAVTSPWDYHQICLYLYQCLTKYLTTNLRELQKLTILTWKTHVFQKFHDVNKISLGVYKEHLEICFLKASRNPYYLIQQAEECLQVEFYIACHFYDNTHNQLLEILQVAFPHHFKLSLSTNLLDHDVEVDEELLNQLYTILSNIPDGLETLRQEFKEHVKQAGLASVANLIGTDLQLAATPNAKAYYSHLVDVCFRMEVGFIASLDRACGEFVNRNGAATLSPMISAELLVTHVDDIPRRIVHWENEGSIKVAFRDVMVLFKYIEDKDVFRELYTQKLAQQQVDSISAPESHQHEYNMISKLKVACGVEYTGKLQCMLGGIGRKILMHALGPLVDAQIVIPNSAGNNQYDLNLDFRSKKLVVDLTRPGKAEVPTGSSEVFRPAALMKSCLYSIRGSIIQYALQHNIFSQDLTFKYSIVKVHKMVREQALIEDMISSVSQQFKPM